MYVIETPIGFVFGFNKTHQCVQVCGDVSQAKQWKREGNAYRFLEKYADCGYGLNLDDAKVRLA